MLFGVVTLPTTMHAQVPIEKSTEIVTISNKQYYMHHVKHGETLYSLARVYQVTEDEIIRLNPEIKDLGLQADMVIGIPVVNESGELVVVEEESVVSGEGYVVYTVEESERTKRLLRRLQVDEEEFRALNPSVGSRVFVGQKVLIPSEETETQQPVKPQADTIVIPVTEPLTDTVVEVETPVAEFVLPEIRPDSCYPSSQYANRRYRVALMVPLYLDDVDKIDTSKDKAEKTKNTRAMKFLQFYEGFMMAVDSMTQKKGMQLDLRVIDVHENTATAHAAVNLLQQEPVDLIVGPFFGKSFNVVEQYARSQNITVVNPLSTRGHIIENASNVIKLKPSSISMVNQLADLIKTHYPKARVTLITDGDPDDAEIVEAMERALDSTVNPDVLMTNAEMLDLIANESARRNMGKRILSTLEVEGQIFSTRALQEHPDGTIYFENHFQKLGPDELESFKNGLSSARDNVLIAYGDDIVFATKILNTINKLTQKYPITLIGLPSWSDFDNLLVPNLLNMNAIYFDDHFVDFNDSVALKFVEDFRVRYESEPSDYAFEGFDIGWYFLNMLVNYGPHATGCLPYEHMPLLHTRFYFTKSRYEDGMENRYWNVYQYDRQSVELKPIRIYTEEE